MKVLPVSFQSFKSQLQNKSDLQYLYTLPEYKRKDVTKQYMALTLLAATTAVGITLFNISGRKRFPYSIAEIADSAKGLNKITTNERLINSLKTDFIYPIKSAALGDKKIKKTKDFKTGFILTGQDDSELSKITNALIEHFDELKIRTVTLPHTSTRAKNEEIIESKHSRNKLNKMLMKEIDKYAEMYKQDGKLTVINIGNVDDLTDLKVIKSQNSNFEELIQHLSSDTENQGIIWCGWTNKQKALPLFLSYLPVLIKRTTQV